MHMIKALAYFAGFALLSTQLAAAAPGPQQKIIFDCDLAGDVDDAFALALILASPEFEVLGIVLDHGNTPGRARVACRLLYELGLERIPVIMGHHDAGVPASDLRCTTWLSFRSFAAL